MAGVNQRLRMTVVALTGGGLWLYSPVEIDDGLAQQLAAVGNVAHVVAPNRYHHLFAGAAKRRYPAAALWAVPGLPEKRPDLRFDGVLGSEPSGLAWAGDLDTLVLTSVPRFSETVFFHRAFAHPDLRGLLLQHPHGAELRHPAGLPDARRLRSPGAELVFPPVHRPPHLPAAAGDDPGLGHPADLHVARRRPRRPRRYSARRRRRSVPNLDGAAASLAPEVCSPEPTP